MHSDVDVRHPAPFSEQVQDPVTVQAQVDQHPCEAHLHIDVTSAKLLAKHLKQSLLIFLRNDAYHDAPGRARPRHRHR